MSKLRFRVVESAFEKKATELTTPARDLPSITVS